MADLAAFEAELSCGRRGCPCSRRARGRARLHCPAHRDERPSLDVRELPDGRLLWVCRAGCDQDQVTEALRERGLLSRPDDARQARRDQGYERTRRNHILGAARSGELSWTAAHYMLTGYQAEQQRRRAEWDRILAAGLARLRAREVASGVAERGTS